MRAKKERKNGTNMKKKEQDLYWMCSSTRKEREKKGKRKKIFVFWAVRSCRAGADLQILLSPTRWHYVEGRRPAAKAVLVYEKVLGLLGVFLTVTTELPNKKNVEFVFDQCESALKFCLTLAEKRQ